MVGGDLQRFVLRAQALALYRRFNRAARQLPPPSRGEVLAEVRREFELSRARAAAAAPPPPPPPLSRQGGAGAGSRSTSSSTGTSTSTSSTTSGSSSGSSSSGASLYDVKYALSEGRTKLKMLEEAIGFAR